MHRSTVFRMGMAGRGTKRDQWWDEWWEWWEEHNKDYHKMVGKKDKEKVDKE